MLADSEPLIGSFTVDGLTYSVGSDGLTLVSVDPTATSDGTITIPATVTFNGTTYDVTAIGPYAFYLSGVTAVELPATITSVDSRAFRSSDVERVNVDADNPNITSFDGALYSADLTRLLLIPEGRKGSVLLSCETEVAEPSLFSHCSLVDAISVEEGGAAFSSWNGLLYDASGETLLRVPAGATEITIRDGCTTIAAGALEGCANLERINAPATVTSISSDVFTSIPTVALPAQLALRGEEGSSVASASAGQVNASTDFIPQITAMVALAYADGLPEINPSSIEAALPEGADSSLWRYAGFSVAAMGQGEVPEAASREAAGYSDNASVYLNAGGGSLRVSCCRNFSISGGVESGDWEVIAAAAPEWYVTYDLSQSTEFNGHVTFGAGWWLNEGGTYVLYRCETLPRTGYALAGIAGSANLSIPILNQAFVPGGAYALTWRAHTYTINLDSQGGSAVGPVSATYDQDATLPQPVREGYAFMGWDTQADGRGTRYAPGQSVRNLTAEDNGSVALYAQWCLAYDLALPICDPAEITFKVDSVTGEVSAVGATAEADGIHHGGTVSSNMDVPVALSKVECEALSADDGRLGLEHVFNASSADDAKSKLSFTLEAATGGSAEVAPGGSAASVADFVIPAVRDGGSLGISYAVKLAEGVGSADIVPDTAEAAIPVASITYTADVVGGIASAEDLFILDAGNSGRVVGLAEIKEDADILATGASHPRYQETYEQYHGYLESGTPGYLRATDGTVYRLRIIGITHDDKTDGSGKAGLTFQFAELMNGGMQGRPGCWFMNGSRDYSSGWGGSWLRAAMQSRAQEGHPGWHVPQSVWDAIVPVSKRYQLGGQTLSTAAKGGDRLFLASYSELVAEQPYSAPSDYPAGSSSWASTLDGATYEYYRLAGTRHRVPNDVLVVHHQDVSLDSSSHQFHWLRSGYAYGGQQALVANGSNGNPGGNDYADVYYGILPCFCL